MITGTELINKVREAAEQNPDKVYIKNYQGKCSYAPDKNNPTGCLIGYALSQLGLEAQDWWDRTPLSLLLPELGITLRAGERPWLTQIQFAQDTGYRTWKDAVRIADGELREVE